jgi:teichuronic acid biosynthesis glycosyltransferase TuaG
MIVSCIITSYNHQDFLEESISSVLNQSYKNLELIIVDDASTDDSLKVISKFKSNLRVKIILRDYNSGLPSVTRNQGIRNTKGQYIAFLDADDIWLVNKLEEQLKHFDDDVIGVGSTMLVKDIKKKLTEKNINLKSNLIFDFYDILKLNNVPLSSLIIKNDGYLFDESNELKYVEDWDFQLCLTKNKKNKIKLLSEPYVVYRKHSSSGTNVNDKLFRENQLNVVKKYDLEFSIKDRKDLYSLVYRYLAKQTLLLDNIIDTKRYLVHSIKNNTSSVLGLLKNLILLFYCYLPVSFRMKLKDLILH